MQTCRSDRVRLLAEDKEMLGVMFLDEAMDVAQGQGMDVVLISPDADPPVCRIMDASKYKFQLEKKDKEAKKKQRESRCASVTIHLLHQVDASMASHKQDLEYTACHKGLS